MFSSWREGHSEIYVMNADGSEQVRLTNGIVNNDSPIWVP
jgi:Tol biopolymer transport system component